MFELCRYFTVLLCVIHIGEAIALSYMCGPFTTYSPNQHQCVNGILVPIHPTSTTKTITSSSDGSSTVRNQLQNQTTYKPKRSKGRNCLREESVKVCPRDGKPICGKLKCCGYNTVYNPREKACCSIMHKAQLYNHPERDYVCCGLHGYERGKQPCLHASQNDRLWKTPMVMKKKNLNNLCLFDYVYVVRAVKRERILSTEREIILQQLRPTRQIFKMDLATDRYTPREPLRKSPLIILSNLDRSKKNEFYVYTVDEVYSRNRKLRLRAINRKLRRCRKPYRHDSFA